MAKLKITRDLILTIANQDKKKFVKNINKSVNNLLALSVESLSNKVSYINVKNVILQPINELLNESFVDNSSCIYLFGIENAQLELNSDRKLNIWRNFKGRLKFAWNNRKLFKRKKRRFRKKKKDEGNIEKITFDPGKYSMFNLAEDLQTSMVNYLTETSFIELKDSRLKIAGRDDFGSTTSIIIYLVSYSNGNFKYFYPNKKGFIEINVGSRVKQLEEKIKNVGENFNKILKIFNTLYYNVNLQMPNQVYLESVLCSCPNQLFEGDIYKAYLKIMNYLSIKSTRTIKSINDMSKTINEDPVCGNISFNFNKMLNMLS